jgi:hypothetical protein
MFGGQWGIIFTKCPMECSIFGGQWGIIFTECLMECSMFGGQWGIIFTKCLMECSMFGGQWGIIFTKCLMECSMFGSQWGSIFTWCPRECSMFSGPCNVPCLVAFGRKRINIIFTSFHFSPHEILFKFFSFDFKILFYFGSKPLFHVFPSFSLTYKLQSCILMYPVFHTFIAKLILIEDFFPLLEFMVLRMIMFYKLHVTQMNKESLRESSLNLTLI